MSRLRFWAANPWEVPADFFAKLAWLPPAQRTTLEAWAREHQSLAVEIDRRYQTGELQGVEDLEARAQALLEWLDAALSELETVEHEMSGLHGDDEPDFLGEPEGEGKHDDAGTVGLEEHLAVYWDAFIHADKYNDRFAVIPHHDHPNGIFTREQQLVSMIRNDSGFRIWLHGGETHEGGPPTYNTTIDALPDEALLAAARDAYARREALRSRLRAPHPTFEPRELRRKIRGARGRFPGGMTPNPLDERYRRAERDLAEATGDLRARARLAAEDERADHLLFNYRFERWDETEFPAQEVGRFLLEVLEGALRTNDETVAVLPAQLQANGIRPLLVVKLYGIAVGKTWGPSEGSPLLHFLDTDWRPSAYPLLPNDLRTFADDFHPFLIPQSILGTYGASWAAPVELVRRWALMAIMGAAPTRRNPTTARRRP